MSFPRKSPRNKHFLGQNKFEACVGSLTHFITHFSDAHMFLCTLTLCRKVHGSDIWDENCLGSCSTFFFFGLRYILHWKFKRITLYLIFRLQWLVFLSYIYLFRSVSYFFSNYQKNITKLLLWDLQMFQDSADIINWSSLFWELHIRLSSSVEKVSKNNSRYGNKITTRKRVSLFIS